MDMTAAPAFYAQARSETAELLNYDLACLTPDQSLRLDCAVALRLALDDLQGRVVRGESIDVARMLTASEALSRLLPPSALAKPPSEARQDPRQVMWEIYKQMRERGELPLQADFQARIDELEAENERLKALVEGDIYPPRALVESDPRGDSTAIDPPTCDVVPPSEWRGETYAGIRPGPDDPPRRTSLVIEAKVAPKSKPVPPPSWDETPGGRAWQAWHDAGGSVGGDRWADNRE
jgi:hypothetical protein